MGDWSDVDGGASWGRSGGSFGASYSDWPTSSSSISRRSSRGHSGGGEGISGLFGLCILGGIAVSLPQEIVDVIVWGLLGILLLGLILAVGQILLPLTTAPIEGAESFDRIPIYVHMTLWSLVFGVAAVIVLPSGQYLWATIPALIGLVYSRRLSIMFLNLITILFFVGSIAGGISIFGFQLWAAYT